MPDRLRDHGGIHIVPPADGRENREFEARIAQQLALADHAEIEREVDRVRSELETVRREIRGERRILKRTRIGRLIDLAWRCWATFWGLAAVAIPLAFSLVYATSSGKDVVRALDEPHLEAGRVHEGGIIQWSQSFERIEACPGEAVLTLSPLAAQNSGVISLRRPVANLVIRAYPNLTTSWQLPLSMPDGHWKVNLSVDSHCPLREQVDSLATFDVEVLP